MRNFAAILAVFLVTAADPAMAARYTASKVSFQDITGAVTITTTGGEDVELTITQGKIYRPLTVKLDGDELIIAGEAPGDLGDRDCCNERIRRDESLARDRAAAAGKAEISPDALFTDYPVIEIAVPRKNDISFTDARIKLKMGALDGRLMLDACYVYGETETLGAATIGVIAGSRLALGDVKSMLELDLSGDAEVFGGSAAMADIDIAGPGAVTLGAIDGMLDISIAGSGVARTGRVDGPMTVRIAGSGVAIAQGGRADKFTATIDGSGEAVLEGTGVNPQLRLYGSSIVRLGAVEGRVVRHGMGDVYVAGQLVPRR
ncbi:MAG: hypothetical protein U5J99_06135 [Parvularculaceae bacterium]|nr:hypothetical protein [Parvularculaceae bacterium]